MKHFIEKLPSSGRADITVPLCFLAFYDTLIIFDHLHETAFISSTGLPEETEHRRGLRAKMRAEEFLRRLSGRTLSPPRTTRPPCSRNAGAVVSNFTRDDYLGAIVKAKEYIAAGDIYQVNLSQRFSARVSSSPLQLYRTLRILNPAPFAAFLDCGEATLLSSSPERFLRMAGRMVETRPIKGTRPRGRNSSEDDRLKAELLASPKDRAELMMIVDLERNALGRVCEYGSAGMAQPNGTPIVRSSRNQGTLYVSGASSMSPVIAGEEEHVWNVRQWWVAEGNGPEIRVSSLITKSGVPTLSTSVAANDVEDLQFEISVDRDGDGAPEASMSPSELDPWDSSKISSVRFWVLVKASTLEISEPSYTMTYAGRVRTYTDKRHRVLYTTTVTRRNRG